mgnify:CR=1 FL=1|jgi:hypothetical protein
MKKYLNIILTAAILLLLFPFLSFPELWENIYVSVLAFIIAYSSMLLHHKMAIHNGSDEETSLQEYIKELKDRFQEQTDSEKNSPKNKKISDISLDEK